MNYFFFFPTDCFDFSFLFYFFKKAYHTASGIYEGRSSLCVLCTFKSSGQRPMGVSEDDGYEGKKLGSDCPC